MPKINSLCDQSYSDKKINDKSYYRAVCSDCGNSNSLFAARKVSDNRNVGSVEKLFEDRGRGNRQRKKRQLVPNRTVKHIYSLFFLCLFHGNCPFKIKMQIDYSVVLLQNCFGIIKVWQIILNTRFQLFKNQSEKDKSVKNGCAIPIWNNYSISHSKNQYLEKIGKM